MITQQQLDFLRRTAEAACAADMDVALDWHVVAALVHTIETQQAQLTAARPLVEEARSIVNADCDCLPCVRIGALLATYDALAKDGVA